MATDRLKGDGWALATWDRAKRNRASSHFSRLQHAICH
jgi:hypothetical protein